METWLAQLQWGPVMFTGKDVDGSSTAQEFYIASMGPGDVHREGRWDRVLTAETDSPASMGPGDVHREGLGVEGDDGAEAVASMGPGDVHREGQACIREPSTPSTASMGPGDVHREGLPRLLPMRPGNDGFNGAR